jgi:Flp pilus assembly protein TadG
MKKIFHSLNKQKGQSLVELALVVMVVLVIMAGVLDLGRLFYTYLALFDGAQEGATYASEFPTYCLQITERVNDAVRDAAGNVNVKVYVDQARNSVPVLGCQNGTVVSQAVLNSGCAGIEVKVTVEKPDFAIVTPFISAITGPTISLKAETTNKILRPLCP